MAMHAAQIIDLNAYRQSRAASRPAAMTMPVAYVAWWTFVPVVFVPGFI
jgi:hypothetical protein